MPRRSTSPLRRRPTAPPVKRRKQLLPILGLGLLVLLLLGGGLALYVYDKATAPDRSTPIVSASLSDAALVERSVDRVSLYVCDDWPAEQAMVQVSAQPDPSSAVAWGRTSVVTQAGRGRRDSADAFSFAEDGLSQRSGRRWRFAVVEESTVGGSVL